MKTLVNRVSLLLTGLHLAGTVTLQSVQVQAAPLTSASEIHTLTQIPALTAQAGVPPHLEAFDQGQVTAAIPLLEARWKKDYEEYFEANFTNSSTTVTAIASTLGQVAAQTGKKPAVIYLVPRPEQLEIVLITPEGQPIHKQVVAANQEALRRQARELIVAITHPAERNSNNYLLPAQQLYQLLIAPIEAELQAQNIDTLLLCVGAGLRTLPFAALHDGQQFLIEKYSFSRIPAFSLTNTIYANLQDSPVLAMGASEFINHNPLPAVPTELSAITNDLWQGQAFLNQDFTLANLQSQSASEPFKIVHLATHASFQPGEPSNSYIQFWDNKLTLDKINQLRWNNPPLELLVLSACETAIGDAQAELGFAGLALQANVKSAIASLWNVSDTGTLALMTELYRDLKTAPIKAEALRQAQIALLRGEVQITQGQLQSSGGTLTLSPTIDILEDEDLSHPYYWAAFTVVGSPW